MAKYLLVGRGYHTGGSSPRLGRRLENSFLRSVGCAREARAFSLYISCNDLKNICAKRYRPDIHLRGWNETQKNTPLSDYKVERYGRLIKFKSIPCLSSVTSLVSVNTGQGGFSVN